MVFFVGEGTIRASQRLRALEAGIAQERVRAAMSAREVADLQPGGGVRGRVFLLTILNTVLLRTHGKK